MDRTVESTKTENQLLTQDVEDLKRRINDLKSFMLSHKSCFDQASSRS